MTDATTDPAIMLPGAGREVPAGLIRVQDWHPRLLDYLNGHAARRFAPGSFDCGLFVAGAIEAMTGRDLAAGLKGHYTTLKGAQKILLKMGFRDHVELIATRLPEIHPAYACVGDVAVVADANGLTGALPALGIFQGRRIYVLSDNGIGTVPRLDPQRGAQRAFRVG